MQFKAAPAQPKSSNAQLNRAASPHMRFNAKLDGKKENEIDPQTVLLFESDAGWNGSGGPGELKPHQHSSRSVNVALADGSVQSIPRAQLSTLRWDP